MLGQEKLIQFSETNKQYDDVEEFYAILLTNIYMSQRGKTQFRKDHHGGDALGRVAPGGPDWSTPDGFLSDRTVRRWVSEFCEREESDLAGKLRQVATRFNPIREYLDHKSKYPL
jgi:hypothetical protein